MNPVDYSSIPMHVPNVSIHEQRESSNKSSLYNRIKEIVKTILSFFIFTSKPVTQDRIIIRQSMDENSRNDDFLRPIGEMEIHLVLFKRNELKTVIKFLDEQLKEIQQYLIDSLKEFEDTYQRDHPDLNQDVARRLGRARFETFLLEDHPEQDDYQIYKNVNHANDLLDKIANLELDLNACNVRLANYMPESQNV